MTAPADRVATVDAIRGFAVCGILAMNIVAMGMPGYAYVDPHYYGGAAGVDLAAWALAYIFVDGKMRALFAMLFGASLLIVTDRAEGGRPGPAHTHHARMFVLLGFGMLHAWLVWYGDILVEYALCGMIAFAARRWPPSALAYAALLLIGWDFARDLILWRDLGLLRDLASGAHAPADALREWGKVVDAVTPRDATIGRELHLYRGGFADVFAARMPDTILFQTVLLPATLPGTLGFVALGMALHRMGFWAGGWSGRAYRFLIAAGIAALLLYVPLMLAIVARRFGPVFLPFADALSLLLRPFVALAYAAILILIVRGGRSPALISRLSAAGRMAFSNYLGTSLIVTTLFYGYGFGLFGHLSRSQLYWIVAGQWLLILGWSKPWLQHFHYGPFEWAWRSLARGQFQPMHR